MSNSRLEQFSEEYLKELINSSADDLTIALAHIALSAKQAKPVGRIEGWNDHEDIYIIQWFGNQQDLPKGAALYTTPQPAHTGQVNSPMQPLHIDEFGTLRFKVNPIVQHLLDVAGNVGVNMNTIAMQGFEPEDQMQFAQLIGYSLGGYGELSYVTDESYERASAAAPKPESE